MTNMHKTIGYTSRWQGDDGHLGDVTKEFSSGIYTKFTEFGHIIVINESITQYSLAFVHP